MKRYDEKEVTFGKYTYMNTLLDIHLSMYLYIIVSLSIRGCRQSIFIFFNSKYIFYPIGGWN